MNKRATKTDSEALAVSDNPESEIQHPKSGPVEQQTLALPSSDSSTGPVECLGMSFSNDDERRKYFLKKLAEKLKDTEFRKIEGFPIGEDEDILALSDPPYYTACPNPWLADFVKHYGTPYNPKKRYHREPFAADVSEGKNHPIYNAHSYHTKVPHRAIMRYILHYTLPGDLVFDGFAGTGMTGVAAHLSGDREEVQALGYRVREDGTILDENGKPFSMLGTRRAILNDLSPAAMFIAYNYNTPVDKHFLENESARVLCEVDDECGWMYSTLVDMNQEQLHKAIGALRNCRSANDCRYLLSDNAILAERSGLSIEKVKISRISYVVWSDVFACPECSTEIIYWDAAIDWKNMTLKKSFDCPNCRVSLLKRNLSPLHTKHFDADIQAILNVGLQVPVFLNYRFGNSRGRKKVDDFDRALIEKIEELKTDYWYPTFSLPAGYNTSQPIHSHGFTHVHLFYTRRNLLTIAALWNRLSLKTKWLATMFLARNATKLNRFIVNKHNPNGRINGPLAGTLYIPSEGVEQSVLELFKDKSITTSWNVFGNILGCSSSTVQDIQKETVDYIFVDPPFGGNIMYSEMNFLWESWIGVRTNNKPEAITNVVQKKELTDYRNLIYLCFRNFYTILKPGRWITVEFSNTQASVWNTIQSALQEAGFVIANVSILDKQHAGQKAAAYAVPVKQDLIISAYKPNGGLEERFVKRGETEDGVWDFVRIHLANLPVVKPRGGLLEPIAERDPRILFDRTVAFYIRHGIPVPISSPEFQAGLAEKFPERDGMYFLPDQAAEYDKVRMKMEGIGQLSIFVMDERSAADWLRNYLKAKPSKYQDIQPEFFEQLNQAWKKWETRPELRALLDQYFLCYDGDGSVPPQIHSYLSSNFKELRNLPSDHPVLRSKGRDRWYVPDPKKNADVERMREKRLLEEFWSYLPPGYEPESRRKATGAAYLPGMEPSKSKLPKGKRLAIVRTEAVRVGFNYCFSQNDYQTIIAVAQHIPDDVIHNDEQLQMIYDSAVTREGAAQE